MQSELVALTLHGDQLLHLIKSVGGLFWRDGLLFLWLRHKLGVNTIWSNALRSWALGNKSWIRESSGSLDWRDVRACNWS